MSGKVNVLSETFVDSTQLQQGLRGLLVQQASTFAQAARNAGPASPMYPTCGAVFSR
eukprot:gene23192-30406_t